MKKTIVISAVNLRKGGTLTILRQCLEYLSDLAQGDEYKIVAIVHKKELADYKGIEYIEMPGIAESWFSRIWCEYVTMYKISQNLSPVFLWLSLHDTTPNVKAQRRAVYCHNPFPFYSWKWKELFLNYRIVFFAWFSKYIYQINLHKNRYVLVQQQWIKDRFMNLFHLPADKIIVTLPTSAVSDTGIRCCTSVSSAYTFLYSSFPDIHKNFETLCRAAALLEKELGTGKFRVVLTISGNENRYARWLHQRWGHLNSIEFAGFMSREQLYRNYASAHCLVFPSRVETWGLPISEFAEFGKPMLLADLPYAHETAAGSRQTAFFDSQSPESLMNQMKRLVNGDVSFLKEVPRHNISKPATRSWKDLFDLLLQ